MEDPEYHHHITLLTGRVQGGKTTQATLLVNRLVNEGFNVMGFLCPGTFSSGVRSAFSLVNIKTGDRIPMGSVEEPEGWVPYRRFHFNPEAFRLGSTWIRDCKTKEPDLVVIDEVGPMELEEMGWWEILQFLCNQKELVQLWIVREHIIQEVAVKWKIPTDNIVRMEALDSESELSLLKGKLKLRS